MKEHPLLLPPMTINTKFSLKDSVYITKLNTNGIIMALYINVDTDIQYSVRYFKENIPQTTYFYDFELESYKEIPKNIGFSK